MGSEATCLLLHQSGVIGFHQFRSRCSRFLLFKRLDYVQWICTVVVFLFFVALFQMFLPGSVIEENGLDGVRDGDLEVVREIREFDFGESVKEFHHWKVVEKFKEDTDAAAGVGVGLSLNVTKKRFCYRKPQLAFVFPDLLVDQQSSFYCNMDQQSSFHCLGLFLGMQDKGSVSFAVDYEFAARTKPADEFTSKYKGDYTFIGGKAVGFRNMFSTPWSSFIAQDSPFFINGILHLRADISIEP